jgi:hypothetical protein
MLFLPNGEAREYVAMTTTDPFIALRDKIFALYERGNWQAGLAALEEAASEISAPPQVTLIIFWRACFLTLLGQGDHAIRQFQEGLQHGYWWAERSLRYDPDPAPLQGTADFETIIAASEARCAASAGEPPATRLLAEPPAEAARPYPLAVALHGYNSTAA